MLVICPDEAFISIMALGDGDGDRGDGDGDGSADRDRDADGEVRPYTPGTRVLQLIRLLPPWQWFVGDGAGDGMGDIIPISDGSDTW